jgi:signal transduction histidine kinase
MPWNAIYRGISLTIITMVALSASTGAWGQLSFEPSWQPPIYHDVRAEVFQWIDHASIDATLAQEARSLWPSLPLRELDGPALLDLVIETAALVDKQVAELVKECNQELRLPFPPDVSWIDDSGLSPFAKNNLQLYMARWFAQQTMYDYVLDSIANLETTDVVDPASLLFYKMVAYHQLVEPDQSRSALVQLLEHEDRLPLRYRQIAEMVRQDLASLKDESLDHVSRRMNDVRRRLELGQAGKQVQVVEKGVVDSLDSLIKKIEEQQQQQSGGGAGSAQSSTPMQDSQLPSMKAPGKVDPRDIGHQSGWGDLPPKEREEALQQIGREYPAHYRQLIEQYFRDLADESAAAPSK